MSLSLFLLALLLLLVLLLLGRHVYAQILEESTTSQSASQSLCFHLLIAPPRVRAPYSIGLLGVPEAVQAKPAKPMSRHLSNETHISRSTKAEP